MYVWLLFFCLRFKKRHLLLTRVKQTLKLKIFLVVRAGVLVCAIFVQLQRGKERLGSSPEGRERAAGMRRQRVLLRMQFSSDNRGAIYRVNRFLDVYVLRTNYTMPSRAMLSAWFAG